MPEHGDLAMTARHELDGLVALVTGGARNVGRAIARRLAADGATVVVNYFRSPAEARTTCAEIEAAGGRAVAMRASVAQPDQLDRMFAEIESTFGRLDVLVNNAAHGALVRADDVTEAELDRALDTNVKGSLGCARRARSLMARGGSGSIVNLSTLGGGQFVMANYLACGPAKAAVEALTRYLAVAYAADGIRVNTAAAGMLASEVADLFPQAAQMQQAVIAGTPLGRLGRPEELAEVVAFLASPRASWITGQILLADGGMSTGFSLLSAPPSAAAPTADGAVDVGAATSPEQDAGTGPDRHPPHQDPPHQDPPHQDPPHQDPPAPEAGIEAGLDDQVGAHIDDEIAVVGMGITVAGANDPEEFWRLLLDFEDLFVGVPPERWDNRSFHSAARDAEDKTYSDRSAFVTDFRPHPHLAAELAAAPDDAPELESTTLWLRHALVQALDGVARRPTDAHAFLVGYTADGSQHLEEATVRSSVRARIARHAPDDVARDCLDAALARCYPRGGPDPERYLPHRVAHEAMRGLLPGSTDLLVVDTACSSSLYAIDIGRKGLQDGRYDVAVCGGAFSLGPRGSILFAKLNGLSARGEVRSLDRDGDGVLFADGAAVVVLKRLSRARADGDTVLATLPAFGSSSDGKGKAIYAPSAAGQKLAIERALSQRPGTPWTPTATTAPAGSQVPPATRSPAGSALPDWVVAHATGTPAGDLAEFTTLRESFAGPEPVYVTSNKSVVGHTGWAAGAVSLIQVVLAMRHGLIAPQHRFVEPPTAFRIGDTNLEIPTAPMRWPAHADGRRRRAAVSGFGFGGTNGHLLVQDPPRADAVIRPARATGNPERIAVIAMATHLPGGLTSAQVADRIGRAGDLDLDATFGDAYPLPSIQRVRIPPATMRSIDRCQLMVLECAHELREQLGAFWDERRITTGVVLGHLGATRNATHYATRCYLDDLDRRLPAQDALAGAGWLAGALTELRADIGRLVPASNEDTFPGMMPNVIPARVANYFDLKGLNMTVDTGFTSALSAVDLAVRYLRSGDLTIAVAGGISGNSTGEVREILASTLAEPTELAEGAFLFALTTESAARAAGRPILGFVETAPTTEASTSVECGARAQGRRLSYLGGEGGFGLVQALSTLPADGRVDVRCDGGGGVAPACVQVTGADVPAVGAPAGLAAAFYDDRTHDGSTPLRIARHTVRLRPDPGGSVRAGLAFWTAGPTIVLTNRPDLIPAGPALVLSTTPVTPTGNRPRTDTPASSAPVYLADADPVAVRDALRSWPEGPVHIRVVADLSGDSADLSDISADPAAIDALHELTFLVAQQCFDALNRPESSCLGLVLHNPREPVAPASAGLFTGLFKVIHLERPDCLSFVAVSDAPTLGAGAEQVERESALGRGLPVVHYTGGTRSVPALVAEPGELLAPGAVTLGPDSVVVAVGGGRGITAELMVEVARQHRCRIVLIGSNHLHTHPETFMALDDGQFAASRAAFIRTRVAEHPGTTPKVANAAYQRMADARTTVRNMARMAEHSGPGRVSYASCDVTDAGDVARMMPEIVRTVGPIDLLVNAAGLNRSAPLSTKSLAEFRLVRDLKVRGYRNLKAALQASPPRMWCNFGSLLGMTGQIGESDYASANDFLAQAAIHHCATARGHETTIGWTLWGEVGLGADDLTRAYFEKSGLYSAMSTAEGAHHFIRELAMARPEPLSIHLGDAERSAVDRLVPGFLTRPTTDRIRPGAEPDWFYAHRVVRAEPDRIEFERTFDLGTDAFLRHHLVGGVATLPGTFVTEIAFEAASQLVADQKVYAFEDLKFEHFLKVRQNDPPVPRRIVARVVQRRPDLGQTVVEVIVASDVVAPNGTVLVRDRRHFRTLVLMADALPTAPVWQPWPAAAEVGVLDPYHAPGSPVLLSDLFVSTRDPRLHPWGKRATYDLTLAADDPVFSRFRLPTILLDGLARTGVLAVVNDDLIPLAAPLGIRRIDVYEHLNDVQAARAYGHLDLYAVVSDEVSGHQAADPHNHFAAVRPDGRILLQMKDLTWTVMGFLRAATGEFLTPDQAARLMPAGSRP